MQEQKPPKPKEIVKLQIIVDHLTAVQECNLEKEFISLVRRCCRKKGPIPCEGMEPLEAEGVVIIDDEGLVIPVCVAETMDFMGVQQVKAKAGGEARAAKIRKLLENVPQASDWQATSKPQATIKQATELPNGCPTVALVQFSSVHAIHAKQSLPSSATDLVHGPSPGPSNGLENGLENGPPKAQDLKPKAQDLKPLETKSGTKDFPEDFKALWEASPQLARQRSGMAKAYKSWKDSGASKNPEKALEALRAASKSSDWVRGFIPGLHRWLNDGGWMEVSSSPVTQTGKKTDDYSGYQEI